jgi:hypothetical protein
MRRLDLYDMISYASGYGDGQQGQGWSDFFVDITIYEFDTKKIKRWWL